MTRTHVEYGGYLCKLTILRANSPPPGARFVARGRLVNPNGHYADAPYVNLYHTPQGYIAVY